MLLLPVAQSMPLDMSLPALAQIAFARLEVPNPPPCAVFNIQHSTALSFALSVAGCPLAVALLGWYDLLQR